MCLLALRELGFGFGNDVMDMDCLPVDHGAASHWAPIHAEGYCREWSVRSNDPQKVIIYTENLSVHRLTKPCCILGNYIKDGLKVRRRTGDHAQDLTSGGLLLCSFGEFSLTGFELFGDAL
jgi:hypothetical protein